MLKNVSNFPEHPLVEVINSDIPKGQIKYAIFDFDGTISLIREGWQQIMIPMMVDILLNTPDHEGRDSIEKIVKSYVANTTGKQTIYQMIRLAEEEKKRSGKPKDPLKYKEQYHKLLLDHISHRLDGLRKRTLDPEDFIVPGAITALERITEAGVTCFLASGTDEKYVIDEARLLGVTPFFKAIYGAQDDYKRFSKRMVIQKIIHDYDLNGPELVGFGDGYVEIEDTKAAGGIAVGLATDEASQSGIDEWKRDRLIASGADIIMPDFTPFPEVWNFMMMEE